jgi:aminomethyltransferase
VLTNERGGIIDDCMITSKADHLYMVINAGCKEKDIAHLSHHLAQFNAAHASSPLTIELFSSQYELLALQGPKAAQVLQRLVPGAVQLSQLPFMFSANVEVCGVQCIVSRCGYTGEDGFEISIPANQTKKVFHTLLADKVRPRGRTHWTHAGYGRCP